MKTFKDNILEEIRLGNDSALEDIYKHCFPITKKYVLKNSGTEEEAKDIFQDGIHLLLHKIYHQKLEPDIDPGLYLLGICKNLWLKRLVKIQNQADFTEEYYEIHAQDNSRDAYDPEAIRVVYQYLEQTGGKCKSILMAFYFQNLSMKQIAKNLGYKTEASAKNRKYSCLQMLIQLAKEELLKYL